MKNPPHTGLFIRTEIIEPTGLTVTAAAKLLDISPTYFVEPVEYEGRSLC